MSEGAIEPSAIIRPSGEVVRSTPPPSTGSQRFYETYNTREMPSPSGGGGSGFIRRPVEAVNNGFSRLPGGPQAAPTPGFLPSFLGSRSLIMFAWAAAMVMVSLDEWHSYHILPRPARLWDTTLTFALIAGVSAFDPLVPICSIFAIGLVIALGYQYYSGGGQFGGFGATEANQEAQTNG